MESMNVQEMTDRLKRLYPRISAPTKQNWDKAIRSINHLNVKDVNDDVALEYLECGTEKWCESTVKSRISALKGIWNKARKKKLYKGENPWLDLDDGLEIARREPTVHPWEFYEYYHQDPYFVCLWYSGMRIGELAGIYPEHIHLDAKIPYFDLTYQENRGLKNRSSIRQVPIHSNALSYVERLYFSKAKNPGRSWSDNFRKNLCLPLGDGAHSIRHSFVTRMRAFDVHEYWIDRLTGHARKTETARYGSYDLASLNEQLQKLR
jgi:integrase